MKGIKKENIILGLLAIMIGQVSICGLYPLLIAFVGAAYIEGCSVALVIIPGILSMVVSHGVFNSISDVLIIALYILVIFISKKNIYVSNQRALIAVSCIIFSVKIGVAAGGDAFIINCFMIFMEIVIAVSAMYVMRMGIAYILYKLGKKNISKEEMVSIATIVSICVAGIFMANDKEITAFPLVMAFVITIITEYLLGTFVISQEDRESYIRKNYARLADERLFAYAESINRLSRTLYKSKNKKVEINKNTVNEILDGVLARYCTECDRCTECWNDNLEESYNVANIIVDTGTAQGVIDIEEIPNDFKGKCRQIFRMVSDTNLEIEATRINNRWIDKMAEAREAMAGQLFEMSEAIHYFSRHLYDVSALEHKKERKIYDRMRNMKVSLSDICCFRNSESRLTIIMNMKALKGIRVTVKDIANELSEIIGTKLVPQKGERIRIPSNYDNITFVEQSSFRIYTGVARSSKSDILKKNILKENEQKKCVCENITEDVEDSNGDNYSIIYLESYETVMMLSDGMGTGRKASRDSEDVIDILENFFEAGFNRKSALKLLNSVMLLSGEENTLTTLDMCIINQNDGNCDFVKIGAAPSFIKQSNHIEIIDSQALPLGMFEKVEYDKKKYRLKDGEYVIMVTDGVLDCLKNCESKEDELVNIIKGINARTPQSMAELIIKKVQERSCSECVDDMSVIVASVVNVHR